MFIHGANFHIGIQGDFEWLKRSVAAIKKVATAPTARKQFGIAAYNPDEQNNFYHRQFFGAGYVGVSHVFFDRWLVQCNFFGGYLMSKTLPAEFFNVPYFMGGEVMAGYQFNNNMMFGLSGGIENMWHHTAKVMGTYQAKPKDLDFNDENESSQARFFGGLAFKYKIKTHISTFIKAHFMGTKEHATNNLKTKSDGTWNIQKNKYLGMRFLIGMELTV